MGVGDQVPGFKIFGNLFEGLSRFNDKKNFSGTGVDRGVQGVPYPCA
jgi:hypothetical protein